MPKQNITIANTFPDAAWEGVLSLYGHGDSWWNIEVKCPQGNDVQGCTYMPFTDADAMKLRDALLEAYPLETKPAQSPVMHFYKKAALGCGFSIYRAEMKETQTVVGTANSVEDARKFCKALDA